MASVALFAICIAIGAACCMVCLIVGYCVGRGGRSPRSLESARLFIEGKTKEAPTPQPNIPLERRVKFEY